MKITLAVINDDERLPPLISFECTIEASEEWRKINWTRKADDLMEFVKKHELSGASI